MGIFITPGEAKVAIVPLAEEVKFFGEYCGKMEIFSELPDSIAFDASDSIAMEQNTDAFLTTISWQI